MDYRSDGLPWALSMIGLKLPTWKRLKTACSGYGNANFARLRLPLPDPVVEMQGLFSRSFSAIYPTQAI